MRKATKQCDCPPGNVLLDTQSVEVIIFGTAEPNRFKRRLKILTDQLKIQFMAVGILHKEIMNPKLRIATVDSMTGFLQHA